MRVKLDENIPVSAGEPLRSAGHDVDTVIDEGLAGATDVHVLADATSSHRLVITLDRGFADIRTHPPGSMQGSSCSASRTSRLRPSWEVESLVTVSTLTT